MLISGLLFRWVSWYRHVGNVLAFQFLLVSGSPRTVTVKVKGQGHCKNGQFHEISIFWHIFGNLIARPNGDTFAKPCLFYFLANFSSFDLDSGDLDLGQGQLYDLGKWAEVEARGSDDRWKMSGQFQQP